MIFFYRSALARRTGAVALLAGLALGGAIPAAGHVQAAAGPTSANT
jgi:hypothetical protein